MNIKTKLRLKFSKSFFYIVLFLCFFGCKTNKKESFPVSHSKTGKIEYAKGFTIEKSGPDITLVKITSPWPNAKSAYTYALVPKDKLPAVTLDRNAYDAIIGTPVESVVVTSTTHIPALEGLGILDKLVGFPETKYISSKAARNRIEEGQIKELGSNETLNTEMVIALQPELVVGFSINAQNKAYNTLERSRIPVVYNGDWTEETPLGKAEWIKFFAPFFNKEKEAENLFSEIVLNYNNAKEIAAQAPTSPTVISGAMYKDVWYLPGGKSWAAQFIKDANAHYMWAETQESGSLSLSWESVLQKGKNAEYWIAPSQFTSYKGLGNASEHYKQFDAFKNRNIFTYASKKGESGGLLYYELAPQRPDWVLQDLIHIFHPNLLLDYDPHFFKPLE
ncbi:ABC transporter substrate-binding protein [Maribacter cobaltidurans]|uniref:ABC transporter substrate-binding protein n=1 Tax=Maribacter cobaltidurans TaxID=1178778 RepID=A0A223V926_9FLAO|nr:ABC transporter substrate-binding protein [Maribacter cobaltidurans]ASV31905.1 ABC transporter substrate-binding protein [Maribacter cobaltidurans]GGD85561.1 ABC transporter substrate-binding protein [Maribacter cobaltidurans]